MMENKIKIGPVDSIIFFGGGLFLVNCAREIEKKGLKTYIFAVKRHLEEIIDEEKNETMEQILRSENIPFYPERNINSSKILKDVVTKNTIGIGIGEVYTFSQETIQLFNGRLFDFMVIKLPEYRGGAHFTWQILRNDKRGSWNIQIINEKMIPGRFDSGGIIMRRDYNISENSRIPRDYFNEANSQGLKLFIKFLEKVQKGHIFTYSRLNEKESTFFPRLYTLKHGYIDWSLTGKELERFICAFDDPYNGASTFLDQKRVFLKKSKIIKTDGNFHPFMAGIIYRVENNTVYIATRDDALTVNSITDDLGNNLIPSLLAGQRFYTPKKYLEEAMMFNAEYNTEGIKMIEKDD